MALTSITNIPAIMRANKWNNGAALMDKWFAGPPTVKPVYTTPDTTTIKMDAWVLTFARAKTIFDAMVREKVWMNDSAKPIFATRLRALGMFSPTIGRCFDISNKNVQDQHALHVNFRQVALGMMSTTLDDMEAALANFSIYVTPLAFDVTPESGKFRISLSQVGFHVMDSYDFEGDQDLGYWDESANEASAVFLLHGTDVTNATFRQWRTDNSKGGDFLVFSDVKKVTIAPPDSFLV